MSDQRNCPSNTQKTKDTSSKSFYKYCFVPKCSNTTQTAPDKIFIRVPQAEKIRKQWVAAARSECGSIHKRYCCEDHFNVSITLEI